MTRQYPHSRLLPVLLAVLIACGGLSTAAAQTLLLDANFNDKTPGQLLGLGGPTVGEPVTNGGLQTLIVESAPGQRHVSMTRVGSTTGRTLRFEWLQGVEVTEGQLEILMRVRPDARNAYAIYVREAQSSAFSFLTLSLLVDGRFHASDESGVIPTASISYTAGAWMEVRAVFDMDAGTHSLYVDGNALYAQRVHGISGRGVGAVLAGYTSGGTNASLDIDDLRVTQSGAQVPDVILQADHDGQTVGAAIGTRGARFGEPAQIDASLLSTVVEPVPGNPALRLQRPAGGGGLAGARWRWLDGIEVESGTLSLALTITPEQLADYTLTLREADGSALNFARLDLQSSGDIVASDANGSLGAVATYSAGQPIELLYQLQLDQGLIALSANGSSLYSGRAYGIAGRGLGQLVVGMAGGASSARSLLVDDIEVTADAVRTIPAVLGFVQQPTWCPPGCVLFPAVQVAAVNVFNEIVPNGIPVSLELALAPAGAVVSGTSSITAGGTATFPSLRIDTEGNYRLRARAGRTASALSLPFSISGTSPDYSLTVQGSATPGPGTLVSPGESLVFRRLMFVLNAPTTGLVRVEETLGAGLVYRGVNPAGTDPQVVVDESGPALQFGLPAGTPAGVYAVEYRADVADSAVGFVQTQTNILADGGAQVASCPNCSSSHPVPRVFDSGFE